MTRTHPSNNFDAIRLGAALAVIASHHCVAAGLPEPRLFGAVNLGAAAVLVFFAVSGFLVASSWMADPEPWRFAARRLLRILPGYATVVIVTAALFGFLDPRPLASTAGWMYAFKHLTFQPLEWLFFPALHDPRMNAPLWTITYELGCYAVFGLAAVSLRRWWRLAILLVCAPAFLWWGYGMAAFDASSKPTEAIGILFGAFFGAGAALAAWPVLRTPRASAVLVALGVIAYTAGSQVIGLALTLPVVTVFVGTRAWPFVHRAGRFGDLSYGLYLWGWPVQQVVASQLGPHAGYWRILSTSLVIALPVAALSWHLVERRALRLKPSSRTAWPRALKLVLK